ncbi:hypothetical protein JR316_0007511 [Psilocybe cubensis]|nr:uncharacterized protein JR316_0013497 [Psilocybe cubensis]XP_047743775.1 hypothetical protein JR316_0011721 [Psilocybe cubensis]XP_047743787.1 hypothetical protein JR316_0011733 [Psilocybe cubensis]XP_047743816.1 hypothetical protein JR316_0011762 [Psilocybe cubensis]XP_047748522.1 hypothetical protein JR316_0007499 [Psilocybe cubensis]XP_047748534.1 hypothetical protein JR316_0007511 [Psilocybe cubensis]KAH9474224.1 hypothetical protein JR316_0013497 [Psilocybe cubensis]KAH9476150.1 hypo
MAALISQVVSAIVGFKYGLKHSIASGCWITERVSAYVGSVCGEVFRYIEERSDTPVMVRGRNRAQITDVEAQNLRTTDADCNADFEEIEDLLRIRQEIMDLHTLLDNKRALTRPMTPEAHNINIDRFALDHRHRLNDIAIEAQIRAKYPSRNEYLAICKKYEVSPFRT